VNYAFIEHFQTSPVAIFTVRRLERLYGRERIPLRYDLIAGRFELVSADRQVALPYSPRR